MTKYTLGLAAAISLLLFSFQHFPATAQGGGIQSSNEHSRHFEGERFVTVNNIQVHLRPSRESEIVLDIPRMRMVYARPASEAGWLEVFGAGIDRHPYEWQGRLRPVEVESGKLALRVTRIDRNVYRRLSGFVEATGLGSLDQPLPLPHEVQAKVVAIPGPLESIGVAERRFLPREPLASPFRSVVRIVMEGGQSCTGFVVEKPGLIATSGHCFADGRAGRQVSVMVPVAENGYRQAVALPARIIYWRNDSASYTRGADSAVRRAIASGGDSALLQVTDTRIHDIPPLALATPGQWLRAGAFRVMTLGFGADLSLLKEKWTKSDGVPHGDVCTLTAGQVGFDVQDKVLNIIPTNLDCVTGPGDSGGPLLIFNATTNRYEVIGIATWGFLIEKAASAMSNEARALLENVRQAQSKEYGGELRSESVQGISTLRKLIDRSSSTYQSAAGWLLDERLYREVATMTGRPSAFDRLYDAMLAGPSSILSLLDEVEYDVNQQGRLDNFRRARLDTKTPLPAAGSKQARETYGDRLLPQKLREQNVTFKQFRHGKILDLGRLLVPQSEFAEYAKTLQPEIDALLKQQPHLAVSMPRIMERIANRVMIEAGPDLYVVNENLQVVEIMRYWMRDFNPSASGSK